jgi:hypothetical protein
VATRDLFHGNIADELVAQAQRTRRSHGRSHQTNTSRRWLSQQRCARTSVLMTRSELLGTSAAKHRLPRQPSAEVHWASYAQQRVACHSSTVANNAVFRRLLSAKYEDSTMDRVGVPRHLNASTQAAADFLVPSRGTTRQAGAHLLAPERASSSIARPCGAHAPEQHKQSLAAQLGKACQPLGLTHQHTLQLQRLAIRSVSSVQPPRCENGGVQGQATSLPQKLCQGAQSHEMHPAGNAISAPAIAAAHGQGVSASLTAELSNGTPLSMAPQPEQSQHTHVAQKPCPPASSRAQRQRARATVSAKLPCSGTSAGRKFCRQKDNQTQHLAPQNQHADEEVSKLSGTCDREPQADVAKQQVGLMAASPGCGVSLKASQRLVPRSRCARALEAAPLCCRDGLASAADCCAQAPVRSTAAVTGVALGRWRNCISESHSETATTEVSWPNAAESDRQSAREHRWPWAAARRRYAVPGTGRVQQDGGELDRLDGVPSGHAMSPLDAESAAVASLARERRSALLHWLESSKSSCTPAAVHGTGNGAHEMCADHWRHTRVAPPAFDYAAGGALQSGRLANSMAGGREAGLGLNEILIEQRPEVERLLKEGVHTLSRIMRRLQTA